MNSDTVDIVLQELMERGIKTKGGEQIGKTILQVKAQERMVKRIADDSEYLMVLHLKSWNGFELRCVG